jgi:hypothetical protein
MSIKQETQGSGNVVIGIEGDGEASINVVTTPNVKGPYTVSCPNCSNPVSRHTYSCPCCGHPVKEHLHIIGIQNVKRKIRRMAFILAAILTSLYCLNSIMPTLIPFFMKGNLEVVGFGLWVLFFIGLLLSI